MTSVGWASLKSSRHAAWLAAGICVSVAMLTWYGFQARREWQRSSVVVVERRADEEAKFVATALTRDMRAVQTSILASPAWNQFTFDAPHEVTTLVASAFARYPYPEAFLAWQADQPVTKLAFFTRSDRPPPWIGSIEEPNLYPVRISVDEAAAESVLAQIKTDASVGRLFSIFELDLSAATYQIIARLSYRDGLRGQLTNVCGFMVNIAWAREHYFPELTRQLARIGGDDQGLALSIVDDDGSAVVSTHTVVDSGPASRRSFPIAFFDPVLVAVNPPENLRLRKLAVMVSGAADPALAAAIRGADVTELLAALAAVALAIALVMTARAVRAGADLAEMRAEFMSSVTHELKTPIASIRALGDTLSSGRLRTIAAQQEYAALVVQEAKRLARLVDNVLAQARVTDIADVYSFEPLHVDLIVGTALSGFRYQLQQMRFAVSVDIPPDLPPILGDQAAMELVLDNLIDNAIRYSKSTKELRVSAESHGSVVSIRVADRGIGIAEDDLDRVTQKFARGRNTAAGGSGLGLAIAKRVIGDHHGVMSIQSVLHRGTTITVDIPIAAGVEHPRGKDPFARTASA